MQHIVMPAPAARSKGRARRLLFVAIGVLLAALIALSTANLVNTLAGSAVVPYVPSREDGLIPEGEYVTLDSSELPAISRLDPSLVEALRQAETEAAAEGITFQISSGWRSTRYQQWLLDHAIEEYGSEETARQFVASAERSSHITGEAVDIAQLDAQLWLMEHGWRYGLCQTYANERWHFERATVPGGTCPAAKADATQ